MTVVFPIGLMLVLSAMLAMSWRRDPRGERRARSLHRRVVKRFAPEHVYVARAGFGVIGLSVSGRTIVLGSAEGYDEYPFEQIVSVEGLRDGVVLARIGAEEQPPVLIPSGPPGEAPARIRSLALRVTLDGPEPSAHTIEFFDEPGRGLKPTDRRFLQAAHAVETWHRRVGEAIRDSRDERLAFLGGPVLMS